ncbi:type II toxin-antitoxin system RatA family toxin [Fangia hongkongensis]|uniref:type II toxin-antitoxin system RatA family toxin n=1 Tax=Fangia hongkongensis TaxID=270495 RepID=UPI00037825CF|nr:type II toxin-antitoxin system RatA family toxin [Fangia hongkongensis]MBK2124296.1 type II toxin-antitoxin system RatA family toxin [Fangia hongkongensis]
MTTIHRTALVEYSACQMYDLVNDIDHYPEFVPMCQSVEVHKHTETEAEATLKIAKGGIKIDFGTKNEMTPKEEIKIRLMKGPFKRLLGLWKFEPLNERACKVTLDLEFEFSNRMLAMALGVVFNTLANTMLDAFCKRASIVYGENE